MVFYFKGTAISSKAEKTKDNKLYCRINIDQNGEIVTLNCTEEVIKKVNKYEDYNFVAEYVKGEYQGRVFSRMTVTGIVLPKES